jgi:hypothetical protein
MVQKRGSHISISEGVTREPRRQKVSNGSRPHARRRRKGTRFCLDRWLVKVCGGFVCIVLENDRFPRHRLRGRRGPEPEATCRCSASIGLGGKGCRSVIESRILSQFATIQLHAVIRDFRSLDLANPQPNET